jgi:hypothetical protein
MIHIVKRVTCNADDPFFISYILFPISYFGLFYPTSSFSSLNASRGVMPNKLNIA